MAETRKTARALIFESTNAKNGVLMKTEMKIQGKIIPRELKFVDTVTRIRRDSGELEKKFTKVSNQRQYNFMASNDRTKPSVRMLVYEDSSEEEDGGDELRTTPPNPQERQAAATPGAPTKSRKEYDKKILRPKKLVYCSDKENDESYFCDRGNSEENVYKNLTEIITMPKKILYLPTDEELYSSSTNRQIISSTSRRGRKKSRNRNANEETTRRNGKSKNGTMNDDKENNATVITIEYNRDVRQASDSHKTRSSSLKNHDREEFASLSKPGEFTHFRI